ncbi:MAG TPA: cytochrome P450 [Polyangiaceae bacterium LLY-WYZ-15_(1-7)]|nr:cytochrome P450 [Polyangiaceae bacterium LLY-WYZ-15_(1-7)]HJL04428.1 cytochrome P450 [Polyangiaceae bacterium LLY-WYZ-15_(1-7)]HJL09020.1 cytochrome P450 [Polyangiaceae bacterium LLY-WYZ-15_(1-7)]HJL26115.1 cytochrome P450 [Polyangiaceae bacterium LLY-WYZ-15_(1-7)]
MLLDALRSARLPLDPLPLRGAPPSYPLLGHALAMRRDPLRFLTRLAAERGPMAPLHLGPVRGYLITGPTELEAVFRSKAKLYTRRTRVYDAMALFLGHGILTSEGEHWRKHRRIVQPAFHRRRLESWADTMVALADVHMDRWRGELDLADAMMRLTLDIVGRTLFGAATAQDATDVGRAMDAAQRWTEDLISGLFVFPPGVPTARNRRFQRAVATLDRVAYRLIDARLAARSATRTAAPEEDGDDVLSMLVEARDEDGQPLPRKQIRDEVITLLAAGHETTSNALSWTLMLLSKHPEAMRRLREEVDAVLGERPPTAADVPKLTWARWVLDESMRLYPPAWTTGRFVAEAHELGGVAMTPGTFTLLSPWVTHRDPELWDDPEGFDPARWEALSKPGALPPFQFYPFGGGPRKCVGEAFAYLEATLILARIAQRMRLDLVPGHVVTPAPQITLGFEGGLKMHAAPREPS